MTMPRRRFGRTELEVPAITFGGGWVGGLLMRGSEEVREAALSRALEAGIDWIDTAALYGQGVSETVIGQWLAGLAPEQRPRLSTKFNLDMTAGDLEGQAFGSLEASFERLGVSKVPLVFLHNQILADEGPEPEGRNIRLGALLRPGGAADLLDKVRDRGLCDWIGITALGEPAALQAAVDSGRFDAAQVYYNLLNPTAEAPGGSGWNSTDFDGLLQRCSAQDMGVMGIRIFAGGHLASRERHGREIPVTGNTENDAEEARAEAVFEMLGTDDSARARTALRFGLACPALSTIVVGLGEPEHLDEALAAVAEGPLPGAAIDTLQPLWREHPAFRG